MKKQKFFRGGSGLVIVAMMATGVASASAAGPGPGGPGSSSSASPNPNPSFSVSPAPEGEVHINADSLRSLMIKGSPSLVTELNVLTQAKDSMRVDLNSLLPSGSATASLPAIPPLNFSFSAVSFLMPFLAPSNWFNYFASKQNLAADELAYKILELNNYASIYSLYETEIQDQAAEAVLTQEYQDWEAILGNLEQQQSFGGAASQQDVQAVLAQAKTAQGEMLAMQQNIVTAVYQIGNALGFSADQDHQLVFDEAHVPTSQYESSSINDAVAYSVKIAPEAQELRDLINASKDATWSDAFSIMNGGISASAGNPYAGTGSIFPDMGTTSYRDNIPFSLAVFPQVSLDKDKEQAIKITLDQLTLGQTETLGEAIEGLDDANQALAADQAAETAALNVYEIEQLKYKMGATNIENLLTDFNTAHAASITRIEAQTNVDNLRITLERAMLEGEFAELPGCQPGPGDVIPKESIAGKIWHGFTGVFSGAHSTQTLDQLCHSGENVPAPASIQAKAN